MPTSRRGRRTPGPVESAPLLERAARTAAAALLLLLPGVVGDDIQAQEAPGNGASADGSRLYGTACASCHGVDGTGASRSRVGFSETLPDFTDCSFATREPDGDWLAVAHQGGPVRGFARMMPAFGDALSMEELQAIMGHVRSFCADDAWPRGELNLPRPLVTEQVPYLEWRHSAYAGERSCQSCHMPVVEDSVAVSSVLGHPRAGVSRHVFRGGNFFMLRVLARYGDELGVEARPRELAAAARETEEHLASASATLSLDAEVGDDERLRAEVTVENLAGHKLPTAYPSRRAWLHLTVRDATGRVLFESGALHRGGWIEGNDNDDDPMEYEPHHEEITRSDQVQIYEAVMVDGEGSLTTGVTSGVRYVKDNRVLPDGFDKATAGEDIAVQGGASADGDFVGGSDRVGYVVDVEGARRPLRIEAELRYQPIAYRWAQNLRQQDAPEIERFVRYHQEMSDRTATLLARTSVEVR